MRPDLGTAGGQEFAAGVASTFHVAGEADAGVPAVGRPWLVPGSFLRPRDEPRPRSRRISARCQPRDECIREPAATAARPLCRSVTP